MKKVILVVLCLFLVSCSMIQFPEDATGEFKWNFFKSFGKEKEVESGFGQQKLLYSNTPNIESVPQKIKSKGCTDSDAEIIMKGDGSFNSLSEESHSIKGTVRGVVAEDLPGLFDRNFKYIVGGNSGIFLDYCSEDGILSEVYCDEGKVRSHGTSCEVSFGKICQDGACVGGSNNIDDCISACEEKCRNPDSQNFECTDSDAEIIMKGDGSFNSLSEESHSIKGTVRGVVAEDLPGLFDRNFKYIVGGNSGIFLDYCSEDGILSEVYCDEGKVRSHGTSCEVSFGKICQDGACLSP